MSRLYKLSDAELQERARAGNEEAERVLQDRVIVRGLVSRDPTYTDHLWTWLGDRFCLHFKRSPVPPYRVRLIIKINESMNGEFLESNWSEVYSWQKFLRNLQGPEPAVTESAMRQEHSSIRVSNAPTWLRLDQDENDERPYVSIVLNDTIKPAKIKKGIFTKLIRPYQQVIREDFGPARYSSDGYLSRLNALHEQGMSYAQIARHIEEDACCMLARHAYHMHGDFHEDWSAGNWTDEQANYWLEQCSAALYGFNVLGCDRAEIADWLRWTLDLIVKTGMARLKRAGVSDASKLDTLDLLLNREDIQPVIDRETVIHALRKFKGRGKKGLGVRINRRTSS